jgi:hypothetical protein
MTAFKRFQWERALISEAGPPSATTRHVLLTLATHADRAGKAFPSIKTLANETALSKRAVVQHIKVAVLDGWLIRGTALCEGQAWRRSTYVLSIPSEGNEQRASPLPAESIKGSEASAPPLPAVGTELHATPIASDAPGSDSQRVNVGNHGQSNNVQSTSKNNSKSTTPWQEFAKINGILQQPGEKDLPYQLRVIAARASAHRKNPP